MRKEDDCTSKFSPTRVTLTILHLFFFARRVEDGGKVSMATRNTRWGNRVNLHGYKRFSGAQVIHPRRFLFDIFHRTYFFFLVWSTWHQHRGLGRLISKLKQMVQSASETTKGKNQDLEQRKESQTEGELLGGNHVTTHTSTWKWI